MWPQWFGADLKRTRAVYPTPSAGEVEPATTRAALPRSEFQSAVFDDLRGFLRDLGFVGPKLQPQCLPQRIPQWGEVIATDTLALKAITPPSFKKGPTIDFVVIPDPLPPNAKIPQSGIVKKPTVVKRFGTIRRFSSTHKAGGVLTVRGVRFKGRGVHHRQGFQGIPNTWISKPL